MFFLDLLTGGDEEDGEGVAPEPAGWVGEDDESPSGVGASFCMSCPDMRQEITGQDRRGLDRKREGRMQYNNQSLSCGGKLM